MSYIKSGRSAQCRNSAHRLSNMECITPFTFLDKNRIVCSAPCGRCPACYKRRISAWSFRLLQEDKRSTSAMFLTLTYNNEHLPRTKRNFATLDKTHLQKFFKRLRKRNENKLKYYACGEYGSTNHRPHYHIVLFNAKTDTIQPAWTNPENGLHIGSIHYGAVNGASVGYTLKYMSKQGKIPMHKNDDRQPEFSLMSKGIG